MRFDMRNDLVDDHAFEADPRHARNAGRFGRAYRAIDDGSVLFQVVLSDLGGGPRFGCRWRKSRDQRRDGKDRKFALESLG